MRRKEAERYMYRLQRQQENTAGTTLCRRKEREKQDRKRRRVQRGEQNQKGKETEKTARKCHLRKADTPLTDDKVHWMLTERAGS